ncbi:MAG: DUF4160 domain-containing protein [Acidimicrobiales bacterium]
MVTQCDEVRPRMHGSSSRRSEADHFHAIYAEREALVRIDDGSLIGGELPRTAARLVEQWRSLHQAELLANWGLAQEPSALSAIDPLQ